MPTTFSLEALPKKTLEITEDGKLLMSTRFNTFPSIDIYCIETIFTLDPPPNLGGYLHFSYDGKLPDNPFKNEKTVRVMHDQTDEASRVIEAIILQNNKVKVVDVDASNHPFIRANAPTALRCPNCQSTNVDHIGNNRKAFSVGKAVGGALLTGGYGALAGFAGKKGKDRWHCKQCGHLFEQ